MSLILAKGIRARSSRGHRVSPNGLARAPAGPQTIGAALVMHDDDERGSITVGKLADLLLTEGDPVERISDIRRTWLVVKNGTIYRPAELYRAPGVEP